MWLRWKDLDSEGFHEWRISYGIFVVKCCRFNQICSLVGLY